MGSTEEISSTQKGERKAASKDVYEILARIKKKTVGVHSRENEK